MFDGVFAQASAFLFQSRKTNFFLFLVLISATNKFIVFFLKVNTQPPLLAEGNTQTCEYISLDMRANHKFMFLKEELFHFMYFKEASDASWLGTV